jgi:hypothetical protein
MLNAMENAEYVLVYRHLGGKLIFRHLFGGRQHYAPAKQVASKMAELVRKKATVLYVGNLWNEPTEYKNLASTPQDCP